MTREQFIKTNYDTARSVTNGTGIFPDTLMAQAIVESQGIVGGDYYPGESLLAKKYNNFFGIKNSAGWKGATVTLKTGEYIDGRRVVVPGTFRVYPSFAESAKDYVNFLKTNPRYKSAGVFTASNAEEQAQRLQDAGYATDPRYASLLIKVMRGFRQYVPQIAIGGILAMGLFFFS